MALPMFEVPLFAKLTSDSTNLVSIVGMREAVSDWG